MPVEFVDDKKSADKDFTRIADNTPVIMTVSQTQRPGVCSGQTGFLPFQTISHLLSGKPLRRPNRIRPIEPRDGDQARSSATFSELSKKWRAERPRGVDVHLMVDTPAYKAIIAMGKNAIRPILMELRQRPDHWFQALHEITGENPIPAESEGRITEMANAWIEWGKQRGYIY